MKYFGFIDVFSTVLNQTVIDQIYAFFWLKLWKKSNNKINDDDNWAGNSDKKTLNRNNIN